MTIGVQQPTPGELEGGCMTERERRTRSGGTEDNVAQQAPLRVLCTRTLLCARCVHKKRTSGEDGENGGPAIGRFYRGVRSAPYPYSRADRRVLDSSVLLAPKTSIARRKCRFTVSREIDKRSAISRRVRPSARSCKTSRSRGVRVAMISTGLRFSPAPLSSGVVSNRS